MVAREMQVASAPCSLPMQIAEIKQVIGPDQHMEHMGPIGHGFQPVELVGGLVGCRNLHQMLGFINDDRFHLEAGQGLFNGIGMKPRR
jgi:hypothetical protein